MNSAQKAAIDSAISEAKDNLIRAQMQQKRNPKWRSGNGEPIAEVIKGYEEYLRKLESAL